MSQPPPSYGKGPKLDAYTSQSVMIANCEFDIIRQHK